MTQTLFRAGVVGVEEENDTLSVGLSADESDTSEYFMFQRGLPPDNDDDGVYLENGEQSRGGYGEVSSCSLSPGRIEITVSDALAASLHTATTVAIDFSPDQATLRRLEAGLARVFAGTGCRFEVTGTDAP